MNWTGGARSRVQRKLKQKAQQVRPASTLIFATLWLRALRINRAHLITQEFFKKQRLQSTLEARESAQWSEVRKSKDLQRLDMFTRNIAPTSTGWSLAACYDLRRTDQCFLFLSHVHFIRSCICSVGEGRRPYCGVVGVFSGRVRSVLINAHFVTQRFTFVFSIKRKGSRRRKLYKSMIFHECFPVNFSRPISLI